MCEWKESVLGDYAKVLGGYAFKSTDFKEFGDYPVIKIKNIASGTLNMTECQYILANIASHATRFKAEKGDILIAMTGSHITQPSSMVGRVTRYNSTVEAYINQRVGKVISRDKNLLDENFLYYFMVQDDTTYSLANIASGSANQANISASQIEAMPLLVPCITEQRIIAEILASLDDKIDLLTRQNATLEALAKTYFRQWFVEKGCELGRLDSIAKVTMGQSPNGRSYNESGIGTMFFQGRAEFGWRYPVKRLYTTEPSRMAEKGDILMSVRAPVGDLNIAESDCCIGRGLAAINSKYRTFVFYALKEQSEQLDIFNGEGTVFGSITKEGLNGLQIHLPSELQIQDFNGKFFVLDEKIEQNTQQIQTLQKLRDKLLPKLISGEMKVKELK